jgi:Holliday junction DNA helicase RuvA
MIGSLTGIVSYRSDQLILLDVHGVGYRVFIPANCSFSLNDTIMVYTHMHVREDVLELYGFTSMQDLQLFTFLIGVSGVGCKTALTVFSVGSRKEIIEAITGNDVSFFTSVPRLGKKNAQKIIIELKNKLGGVIDLDLSDEDASGSSDVIAALVAIGFTQQEAREAVRNLQGKGETVEEKVRLALKYLGK